MKLTYRVEDDVLVTDQPSALREDRTDFVFEPDGALVLEYGERDLDFGVPSVVRQSSNKQLPRTVIPQSARAAAQLWC